MLSAFVSLSGQPGSPTVLLYRCEWKDTSSLADFSFEGVEPVLSSDGLRIVEPGGLIRLNRYYSLAERTVRYHVRLDSGCRAVFRSDQGDFKAYVDMASKSVSMATDPVVETVAGFLTPGHEYLVEIERDYQTVRVRVADLHTGESARLEATMDGSGGCGTGAVQPVGFFVGRQYDYYCFGLERGSGMLVRSIVVTAAACDLTLLLYGDSITEPEGYYPARDFSRSWVQLILARIGGRAMSSGRGGTTIDELLERIRNELPYVRAKYVMVTIGTNGGNTERKLCELVEYIRSQGAVPILNNIPCNEHGTQVETNELIERVRRRYAIRGCRFDLATSVDRDGLQVDTSTMWREDYGGGHVYYHHPNVRGSRLMYLRTLLDVPEIYE